MTLMIGSAIIRSWPTMSPGNDVSVFDRVGCDLREGD
jgi:hypothetical protein